MGRDLQLYKFTKNLQIVHLKWVNFTFKLYLSEAVKDTIIGIKIVFIVKHTFKTGHSWKLKNEDISGELGMSCRDKLKLRQH